MSQTGYIYKIINQVNEKIYIGKTKCTLEKRFKNHIATAKRYAKNPDMKPYSRLYNSMNKYGYDNFRIELVQEVEITELNYWEKFYINFFNTQDDNIGYNISPGGDGGELFKGHSHSDSSKDKMSKHNYWKTHSQPDSVKKQRSDSLRQYHRHMIQCLDTGEIYYSYSEAEEKTGCNVYYAIKYQGKSNGHFFVLVDETTHPKGYNEEERLNIIQQYENRLNQIHKNSIQKMLNTQASWSNDKKESIKQKARETMKNKTPEEIAEIKKRQSEISLNRWNNLSEEDKKKRSELSREIAIKQHNSRTQQEEREISRKNSITQTGKHYFKNINTNEVKIIMARDFNKYDMTIWKKCHKNGELWSES